MSTRKKGKRKSTVRPPKFVVAFSLTDDKPLPVNTDTIGDSTVKTKSADETSHYVDSIITEIIDKTIDTRNYSNNETNDTQANVDNDIHRLSSDTSKDSGSYFSTSSDNTSQRLNDSSNATLTQTTEDQTDIMTTLLAVCSKSSIKKLHDNDFETVTISSGAGMDKTIELDKSSSSNTSCTYQVSSNATIRKISDTPYTTDVSVALLQLNEILIPSTDTLKPIEMLTSKEEKVNTDIILPNDPSLGMTKYSLVSQLYTEKDTPISDATLVGTCYSDKISTYDTVNKDRSVPKVDHSYVSLTSRSQYYSSTGETDVQSSTNNNTIPDVLPSTSNADQYDISSNVIISDVMHRLYPLKSVGDNQSVDTYSKNVLQKSFDVEKSEAYQMNVTLPNESTIKEILGENLYKTATDESRSFQFFPEAIFEKLSTTLDMAIRRLEESLSDKILNEIRNALQKLEHFTQQISVHKQEVPDSNIIEMQINNDESLQCNLIQSYVIDNLMFEGDSNATASTKVIKVPKTLQDTLKVLKAYSGPVSVASAEGDFVKTSEKVVLEQIRRPLFYATKKFLKENMIVLGSVPAFLLYMLLIYGFIMLVVNVF